MFRFFLTKDFVQYEVAQTFALAGSQTYRFRTLSTHFLGLVLSILTIVSALVTKTLGPRGPLYSQITAAPRQH